MRFFHLVPLLAAMAVGTPVELAARTDALDDSATRAVLEMISSGQTDEEVLEKLDELAPFPEFNGHDLAELKRRGASDRVLLRMLELSGSGGTPQPAAVTTPRRPVPELTAPLGESMIRVLVDCPFDVTYFEIALDGEIKDTKGKLWKGSVGAGEHLAPPPNVTVKGSDELFESAVAPGRHTATVGFAVTRVRQDPSGVWGQEAGEYYDTRGIRATSSFLPGQAPSGNPGAVCDLRAGQLCEITVTPQYSSSPLLGGASVYNVRYQVSVVDRR
jgi:hypothetical protein